MAIATFAAGPFWGVEAAFRQAAGLKSTRVGYCGGKHDNPTHQEVCSGVTGHAESVEVDYHPAEISYEDLLTIFWECHDPTARDRKGTDAGSQYRSVIFYHDVDQELAARHSKSELDASDRFRNPVVTEIVPAGRFWQAEDHHQQYFEKRGLARCQS